MEIYRAFFDECRYDYYTIKRGFNVRGLEVGGQGRERLNLKWRIMNKHIGGERDGFCLGLLLFWVVGIRVKAHHWDVMKLNLLGGLGGRSMDGSGRVKGVGYKMG